MSERDMILAMLTLGYAVCRNISLSSRGRALSICKEAGLYYVLTPVEDWEYADISNAVDKFLALVAIEARTQPG